MIYLDNIIASAFSSLLGGDDGGVDNYRALIEQLTANEQKTVFVTLIRVLSNKLGRFDGTLSAPIIATPEIDPLAGAAALFFRLSNGSADLRGVLIRWLTGSATSGLGQGISVNRAVIASLAHDERRLCFLLSNPNTDGQVESMKEVFLGILSQFGDPLYIKHTPILQQEGLSFGPLCDL